MSSKKANSELDLAREISDRYEEAQLLSPSQQKVWLETLRTQNPYIADQVHSLLYSGDTVGIFLENSPGQNARSEVENSASPFKLVVGERVHHFVIEGVLGAGSFAVVYLATDMNLGRKVALKVTGNESSEAQTLAHLEHDSIVTIFSEEVDEDRAIRFIAMQYIPGSTLEQVLHQLKQQEGTQLTGESILNSLNTKNVEDASILRGNFVVDWEQLRSADYTSAIIILTQKICDAISYAHKQGVLHLDIKPSNIILSHYGRPFLTDFNVSINQSGEFSLENLGGTPRYMAPEQAVLFEVGDPQNWVKDLNPTTDLYSLAVVMKECLELKNSQMSQIDTYLKWILERATETHSKDRYKSAAEFKSVLQGVLDLGEILRATEVRKEEDRLSKHPLILLTLIGAIPQFISTFIGTNYNILRILPNLSELQRENFQWLNLTVTPAFFVLLTGFWIWVVVKLNSYMKDPFRWALRSKRVELLRRHLLNIPKWGMVVTTLGWLPVSVIIPLILHLKYGGLSPTIIGHFAISFFLSWLIALSYSYLFHTYIVIAYLYSRFWYGCSEVREKAIGELSKCLKPVRLALVSIIIIPLGGALMILSTGELESRVESMVSVSQLVSAQIVFSIVGVFLSLALGSRLNRIFLSIIGK